MKLGVCGDPQNSQVLAEAGFEYVELNVQSHLKPLEDESVFAAELERIRSSALPTPVANVFVPGSLKISGPEADLAALEAYVRVVFARARRAGIQTIVLGSGGARRIPEGYDRGAAWQQLVAFGKMIGPLAQAHDIVIVVEPLNQQECNVLTSVGESGRYVEDVNHPAVRLLVDAYHWAKDDHSEEDIVAYGHLLRHVHIATVSSRLAPGLEPCDFTAFFRALGKTGYDGLISIEARWSDLSLEAAGAYQALKHLTAPAG